MGKNIFKPYAYVINNITMLLKCIIIINFVSKVIKNVMKLLKNLIKINNALIK